jgi:hypothetical protein
MLISITEYEQHRRKRTHQDLSLNKLIVENVLHCRNIFNFIFCLETYGMLMTLSEFCGMIVAQAFCDKKCSGSYSEL